jgi:pyruvate/2-oxoglutarate dehydrogenase complex dihydrolipoamide acyltransferase (E2) component
MAERTTQSWTTVPHFFVSRDVDASALNAARTALIPAIERSHSVKVTHTDLLVAAVARALRQHPRMNASWSNGIWKCSIWTSGCAVAHSSAFCWSIASIWPPTA